MTMDETAEHNRLDEIVEAQVGKNEEAIQELDDDVYNDGQRIPEDFEIEPEEAGKNDPHGDDDRMEEERPDGEDEKKHNDDKMDEDKEGEIMDVDQKEEDKELMDMNRDDTPEDESFQNLSKWMIKGGADISKIRLQHFGINYRGVQARQDIKKGE